MSAFIDSQKAAGFAVELVCRTLGVSASAYHQRATGQRSERAVEDERLLALIGELHADDYFAYGSRRMWKALRRAAEDVGRGRVERLMRTYGIQGPSTRSPSESGRSVHGCLKPMGRPGFEPGSDGL